jgi:3-phenylpropionate/trans-cinnamate dioxygenase ferredoxin subunit
MALQYVTFCTVDEVPVGSREVFDLETMSILLMNVDGTYYAVENMCSHEEYELADGELEGCILECPKHSATFDIRSGQQLSTPAYTPIKIFPTRVESDEVQVLLEID